MIPPTYIEHAVRVLITFVLFVVLKWPTNPYVLVLVILLLDSIGPLHAYPDIENKKRVTQSEEYQQADKISDALTYLMLIYLVPNEPVLHFFVLYRVFGVLMYFWTQQVWPVIVFFDFIKEYILFKALFAKSEHVNTIFGVSIVLKILFEAYFHTVHNRHAQLSKNVDVVDENAQRGRSCPGCAPERLD
jgi:hypothetical protein